MSQETEMHSVPSTADKHAAAHHGWVHHRGHFSVALIFAAVGICAAVGLGSGDWYTVEASAYVSPQTAITGALSSSVANGLNKAEWGSVFVTSYFGLRMGYACEGPQTTVSFSSNLASQGFGNQACFPYTYRSKLLAFQNFQANSNDSGQQSKAGDAITAYQHLIGSSSIIISLLALTIVICALQFLGSASVAFGHGETRFNKLPGRVALVIAIICEALVLIFWITIFPYAYFYGQEPLLMWGVPFSYDVYHTLGLGFSIQIAGLLVGLFGLIGYPADAVVIKSGNSV